MKTVGVLRMGSLLHEGDPCVDQHGLLGSEGDSGRENRQVQVAMPLWEHGGEGEVGSRSRNRAGEPQGGGGEGQAAEQGGSPSGLAQGDMQGQAGPL